MRGKLQKLFVFLKMDVGNPCNNRPISRLPVLSKVNERLTHKQFVSFLDHNDKLSQFQSGNRKYHSTETAFYLSLMNY